MVRFSPKKFLYTLATIAVSCGTVVAQTEEVIEEVLVTGSRIKRGTANTPIPVTSISSETIDLKADVRVADLVNELPSVRTTSTAANQNIGSETEAGTNFIDLRGLGQDRTLVLINGRRQVGGRIGSSAVDINTIPSALVESVEVITGGASAVYGADAVSGVVNFLMKDNFEGWQVDAQYGIAGEGDGEQYQISLTGGSNFADDAGNIYFNFTYDESKDIVGSDRSYAGRRLRFATNPASTGPNDGIPDQILFEGTGFIGTPPNGQVVFADGTNGSDIGGPYIFDENGNIRQQNQGTLVESFLSVGGEDAGDLSRFDLLQIPVTRNLFNLGGHYDINDNNRFIADIKYSKIEANTLEQTSFALFGFEPINIQASNPYVPLDLRNILDARGEDNFFVGRTNIDHGRRGSQSDRDTLQLYLGFEGDITDNLQYSTYYSYGKTEVDTLFTNRQVPSRFRQALDAVVDPTTGQIVCRDQSNGCVPINVLGPNTATAAALDFISTDYLQTGDIEQQVFNFTLTGDFGKSISLPGGPIAYALGYEYRDESSSTNLSDLQNSGDLFAAAPVADSSGSYDVSEFFAEINLPLLADVPGAQLLNVDGAIRFSDYSTIGSATAWKVGADWAPVSSFRLRGTASTAVRAPNVGELFAPAALDLLFITDPCDAENLSSGSPTRAANCAAAGLPADFQSQSLNRNNRVVTGGNTNLREEESDSYTIGIVITPEFLPELTLAIDWWDIKISDAINAPNVQDIVNGCYDSASLDNNFCPQITRQANGQFDEVRSTLINIASFEASGLDIEVGYTFDFNNDSSLKLNFIGTYLDDLTFFSSDNDAVGNPEAGELGDPDFVGILRATYYWSEKFTFAWEQRYISDQVLDLQEPAEVRSPNTTGSQNYSDVQFRYNHNENFTAYVGIDNLFDQAPPDLAQVPEIRSFTGDSIGYDQIGRYYRFGIKYNF